MRVHVPSATRSALGAGSVLLNSLLLAGLLLAGCGAANGPASGPSTAAGSSSMTSSAPTSRAATTRTSTARPAPSRDGWTASGPSYGIDRLAWPRTSRDAKALFDRLPTVIDRHRGTVSYQGVDAADSFGPVAVADYGRFASVTVLQEFHDRADKPVAQPAPSLLSAQFGLAYGCAPGTYRGTIPAVNHGRAPGIATPIARSAWFSCHIDGAEGDETFSGEALGWISGPTAWHIVAANRNSLRVLLARLHQAQS